MNKEPIILENRREDETTNATRSFQVSCSADEAYSSVIKVIKKGFFYEYVSSNTIVNVVHFVYSKKYSVFVIIGSIDEVKTNVTVDVVDCKLSWIAEDEKHNIITEFTMKISKELRKLKEKKIDD